MKINRQNFLHVLESVSAGLTAKAEIQNSNCFTFSQGDVLTFNEEIACRMKSGLDDSLVGAVRADELLKILRALPEEEINLTLGDGLLILKGKGKRTRLRLEADVILTSDTIDRPKSWVTLPTEFAEALSLVQLCCGGKSDETLTTYVHITPQAIEATDRFQLARWSLKTNFQESALIGKQAARQIAVLGFTEVGETQSWLHFRNAAGLELSCRRYLEDFPELDKILEMSGEPVTLPKGLVDAASRAHIFSEKNVEGDKVLVELSPGKIKLTGTGVNGEHTEIKKVVYDGPAIAFLIAPELLSDIVSRHNECEIAQNCLKVTSGNYVYITWLKQPEVREVAQEVVAADG